MSRFEELADQIFESGVRHSFGIPGSGATLSLVDALDHRGVKFYITHFEGSGALMAATVGRLSGRAGLSCSIKGPGLVNAAPGIAAAWFEAFPSIHVAEAFPPQAPASQAHKRCDQTTFVSPICKASLHLAESGPTYREIAAYACDEEPGPVVLEIAPTPVKTSALPSAPKRGSEDLKAVMDVVRGAKRPIVIAGALAVRAKLGPDLSALSVPVFSTAAAKGIVDETAPNAAGVFTGVGLEKTPESMLLPKSDLVIGIGVTAREVLAVKPFQARYVAIETVVTPGTDAFAPTARARIDDAHEILMSLTGFRWGLDELAYSNATLQRQMSEGFLPGAVFYAFEQHFARQARFVVDTGYFCTIGEHAIRASKPDLCLMSGQGRYMGTCIPMAIGASLHDSLVPTVAVFGDGGVGMYVADVKMAVNHNLPILFVLMTDGGFGSVRTRAIKEGLTQRPLLMDGKSWVPVFEGLGMPSIRAETAAAVDNALNAWSAGSGPAFFEIPFEPDAYQTMVAGIR